MRPFYYPVLVIIAFAGLVVVGANLSVWERTEVCTRCGRVRATAQVGVFGTPFRQRVDERDTAFTRAWPGALACSSHVWLQTDYFDYRSGARGFVRSYRRDMSDSLRGVLDSPAPALALNEIDPARADGVISNLAQEASQQGGYLRGGRWVTRPTGAHGPTEELIERLREKEMTRAELREWDRERSEEAQQPR